MTLHCRLYRLKVTLLSICVAVLGLALLFLAKWAEASGSAPWLDYTDTTIADMRVSDTVATAKPVQVSRTPDGASGRAVTVELPGWLLPRTGVAFTWTLASELPREVETREAA